MSDTPNETVQEWTPDEGMKPVAPTNGLRKSSFRDEREGVYHLAIPVEGCEIFALEMDDADYAEFKTRVQWLRRTRRALLQIEDKAKGAEKRGDVALAKRMRDSAEADSEKVLAEENELPKWVMAKTLVGWSRARPFELSLALRVLSGEAQAQIVNAVRQASSVGRDSDFLADAS